MNIWTKPAPDSIHIAFSVQSNLIAAWYVQLSISARFPSTQSMSVGSATHTTRVPLHSDDMCSAVNAHCSVILYIPFCVTAYTFCPYLPFSHLHVRNSMCTSHSLYTDNIPIRKIHEMILGPLSQSTSFSLWQFGIVET